MRQEIQLVLEDGIAMDVLMKTKPDQIRQYLLDHPGMDPAMRCFLSGYLYGLYLNPHGEDIPGRKG